MKIYNTLSKTIEEFVPADSENVSLYTCGPTVYDSAHIGNLRTYLFEDFLKRTLSFSGFFVNHVMNITDVDDKTIKKAVGDKEKLLSETKKIEANFVEDLKKLNIELPDKFTRATEYIEQMVALVSSLLDKGFAYKAEDGSIYFSISKFENYGKLSGLDKEGLKSGARVNQDEYDKENPADFVLWKAWDEADGSIFWESTLGKGRPGWLIECSAMSQDALGESIDIHAGAVDLIFPHHENEIAQSEAATGKKFAKYWVHGEHLLVDNKKMSKSLNNFYTLNDIIEKGYSPLDFRYLCLQAHYRSKLNFTWESLEGARNARKNIENIICNIRPETVDSEILSIENQYLREFTDKIANDLNAPEALAVFWKMLKDESITGEERFSLATKMDSVLGLGIECITKDLIPEEVMNLVSERENAREQKNWAESDRLRNEITALGYGVEDTGEGSKVSKN